MEAAQPLDGNTAGKASKKEPKKELDRKVMAEDPKDIRYLPIGEVNIHYNTIVIDGHKGYQRQLNPHKINKMVDEYDPREITAIVVSQRPDGRYWVLDGQHRLEALRLLGKQIILADVRIDYSIKDEARMFYRLNAGTTRVAAWDQFLSRISGEDPTALNILRIVEDRGYHLDRSGNARHGIAAVRSLEKIYRRGYLDQVLEITSTVWRSETRGVDGPVIEGLGIFLHSYGQQEAFEMDRFLDVLAVTPAMEVIMRQKQLTIEMGRSSSQPAVVTAMALRDIYNGKRRQRAKLHGPPISGTGKTMGYVGRDRSDNGK